MIIEDLQSRFHTGFITGTYAWNYPSPTDIDFCLENHHKLELIDFVSPLAPFSKGLYYDSLYISGTGKNPLPINVIFLPITEMEHWKFATEMMKQTPRILNSEIRHSIFEMYRTIHKLSTSS